MVFQHHNLPKSFHISTYQEKYTMLPLYLLCISASLSDSNIKACPCKSFCSQIVKMIYYILRLSKNRDH